MPAQEQVREQVEEKFNLKVHHRDSKGRMLKIDPYRIHVKNGVNYFERPVGSGNLYYENNEKAGRVELIPDAKGKLTKSFDFEATHKDYVKPMSGAEKLHFEHENLKDENQAIKAELAAIRADKEKLERELQAKGKAAGPAPTLADGTREKQVSADAQKAPEVKK